MLMAKYFDISVPPRKIPMPKITGNTNNSRNRIIKYSSKKIEYWIWFIDNSVSIWHYLDALFQRIIIGSI